MPLWNRDTGAIDPKVAEDWRRYDIGHILRTNWPTLAPKLAGKIHITAGQSGNFYLEGAVKLVQSELKPLESDALIEVIPATTSASAQEFFARVDKMIAAKFRDADPDGNGRADTFGMALQAAKPRDLIHMLDLFTFGSACATR